MRWRSFVAVGDSFTEGLDDPYPAGKGYRGWADLVAARLAAANAAAAASGAARLAAASAASTDAAANAVITSADGASGTSAGFRYANLAVRGRLFDSIVDEQVPLALAMRPELVSFAGGGNDVLRRRFDPYALVARFNEVVRALRASGPDSIADVLLFRFADLTTRLPGGRFIRPRTEILNRA